MFCRLKTQRTVRCEFRWHEARVSEKIKHPIRKFRILKSWKMRALFISTQSLKTLREPFKNVLADFAR